MKFYSSFNMKNLVSASALIFSLMFLSGCGDDPEKEDAPELITKATLTFTPQGGGTVVTATATDPDGEGVQNLRVDGPIALATNKTYVLTIALINGLASPNTPEYDISEEVEEEGDEHMFFFAWTNNVFSNPTGNGNVDNRADAVNYTGGANATDANGLPLGLTTTWTSALNAASGTFRVVLKHQPETKSATSDVNVGETDMDITFTLNVQ